MKDGKPRLTRLTAILTKLQSKRLLTARALAEEHGVSLRTIYRDIKTLEQSGVPIFTDEGKGYSLLEDYRLPPVMFTEAEANALITAEQLIANDKDQSFIRAYQMAITKIRAVMRKEDQEKSHRLANRLHVRETHQAGNNSEFLMPLQSALTNHQVVQIHYVAPDGKAGKRLLEPFAIYQTKGNWLLIAHCRLRIAFRTFRLDRIKKITVTSEVFSPHPMSLEEYFYQCRLSWLPTLDTPLSSGSYIFVPSPSKKMMEQVTIASFQLIGITVRTSNHGNAAKDIGGLWEKFMGKQIADNIPNKVSSEIFAIYTEYESDVDGPYTTVLGCKVNSLDEVPEGMRGFSFPGGSYQKFVCKGDLTKGAVYGAWADIWKKDLDRSYVADFEVYGAKAMNPVEAEVDIFVGVSA